MGDAKKLNYLKENKVKKEAILFDFQGKVKKLANEIKDDQARLISLQTTYQQLKDSDATDKIRQITENIRTLQAKLASQGKSKKQLDEYVYLTNQEVVNLNTQIAKEDSSFKLFEPSKNKSAKKEEQTTHKDEADSAKTPKEETESIEAESNTNAPTTNTQAINQQQKKLSAKDIKKQLKANLASGQPKKNITLIRQSGSVSKQPQAVPTKAPPIDNSSNPTFTQTAHPKQPLSNVVFAPIQSVGSVRGIAGSIKNIINTIKNIAKAIRIATTSATLVGAVANIALLFRNKLKKLLQTIAKIFAAIQALLLLMWLWLLAKLAGIIAGALFGAVTGLPILIIPGAGPFLYGGWVSYWAYKGWTDPIATIQLATHPWEAITRPLNWIGDKISGFGSGAKGGADAVVSGVGNTTSGAISTAGNFLTGLASSAWGGITGGLGSIFSSAASYAGSFFSSLASAGSAIVGNVIPVAIGGSIATVAGGTVMATVMTNSAFYTQELDTIEEFSPPNQNEIFTVTKTVDQPTVGNLGATVNFTITIRALKTITTMTITDTLTNGSTTTNPTINCTVPLTAGNTCTQTFPYDTGAAANAIITNSVNVNATADDGTTSSSTASATVTVGSAPQTCQNFQFVSGAGNGGASWTQSEIDTVNSICNTLLARSPSLMTFLSTAPTITLARYTGTCSGAVNGGTIVSFFGCNLSSFDAAKYVVVHELGHVIGNTNLSLYNSYTSSGAYQTEGMIKTYPLCPGNINEGFAEMIADYVVAKSYNFPARCTGYSGGPYATFQSDYPMHYNFARDNIFGGVEY